MFRTILSRRVDKNYATGNIFRGFRECPAIVHTHLVYEAVWFRGQARRRRTCPHLALAGRMEPTAKRRANRYGVNWSMRIRHLGEHKWHTARTVNLSVTGVLLHSRRKYHIGEAVEVEIDFFTQPHADTIISGVGNIIREEHSPCATAAIHFLHDCELTRKPVLLREATPTQGAAARPFGRVAARPLGR
jgi:hypothetical protein